MGLTVSRELLQATVRDTFAQEREREERYGSRVREVELHDAALKDEDLADLLNAAEKVGDGKTKRAIEAVLKSRQGDSGHPVPNFKAFEGMLTPYLRNGLIDGWLYVRGQDGCMYPALVTMVRFESGDQYRSGGQPRVCIDTVSYGLHAEDRRGARIRQHEKTYTFAAGDATKKRIKDILEERGLFHETTELKAAYVASMQRHSRVTAHDKGFARQFRLNGAAYHHEENDWERRGQVHANRRVIHDLDEEARGPVPAFFESSLLEEGTGAVPEHPLVRVFDLKLEEFLWVHGDTLTPYEYDVHLADKLVLPRTHRDLLDVLTADISAFSEDIVEGKAAGNILLLKGPPGCGKTLTAEVYCEKLQKALYSLNAGTLGSTAAEIDKRLQGVFARARRWGLIVLLDEADVYVMKRGASLEHNAIVAEFLRVLEYFDMLMFMTTNRPDDIDDAFIQRCAAIVDYQPPSREDCQKVWQVMAAQFKVVIGPELLVAVLDLFPGIAPRDIKMLLRMALRVSAAAGQKVDIDVIRRCAMFRAIKMSDENVPLTA